MTEEDTIDHSSPEPRAEPAAWLSATFVPKYPLIFPANLITRERIRLIKSIRLCHDCINHIPLVSLSDSMLDTCTRVSKSEIEIAGSSFSNHRQTSVCVCVCVRTYTYSECWLNYRGQKRRDEHLQATIMGNFPTAAELKLPKTKQRGKIYSLVESMGWGVGEREIEGEGEYKTMRNNFFQKYSPVTSIILPFLTSCGWIRV